MLHIAFKKCFKTGFYWLFPPGLSPLHLTVLRGHKDLAKMLLDAGANINAMVSLCSLCFKTSQISHFLNSDFFICPFISSNQDIKSGQSPLMHAVESNNADMVHFLIEVMRLCGQAGKRRQKGRDSALFNKIFSFQVRGSFTFLSVS